MLAENINSIGKKLTAFKRVAKLVNSVHGIQQRLSKRAINKVHTVLGSLQHFDGMENVMLPTVSQRKQNRDSAVDVLHIVVFLLLLKGVKWQGLGATLYFQVMQLELRRKIWEGTNGLRASFGKGILWLAGFLGRHDVVQLFVGRPSRGQPNTVITTVL